MKISEIKFPKLNFHMYHTKNFGNFISEILFRKFLFLYVSCAVSEIKFPKLNFTHSRSWRGELADNYDNFILRHIMHCGLRMQARTQSIKNEYMHV